MTYKTNGKYANTTAEQAPPYAIDCDIDTAITKLAEYETLEEQGKLPKLPCAVGDMVYYCYDEIKIAPMRVEEIIIAKYGTALLLDYCGDNEQLKHWKINVESTAIDCKIIFLTREEAEVALEKMSDDRKLLPERYQGEGE